MVLQATKDDDDANVQVRLSLCSIYA